jgi:hypothetical protein
VPETCWACPFGERLGPLTGPGRLYHGLGLSCLFLCIATGCQGRWRTSLRVRAHQEIAQNSGGRPDEAIGPPLDARLILIKDKDRPRGDHLALRVDEAASDPRDETSTGSFENEERVPSGLDPSTPWRFRPSTTLISRVGCPWRCTWACHLSQPQIQVLQPMSVSAARHIF